MACIHCLVRLRKIKLSHGCRPSGYRVSLATVCHNRRYVCHVWVRVVEKIIVTIDVFY